MPPILPALAQKRDDTNIGALQVHKRTGRDIQVAADRLSYTTHASYPPLAIALVGELSEFRHVSLRRPRSR